MLDMDRDSWKVTLFRVGVFGWLDLSREESGQITGASGGEVAAGMISGGAFGASISTGTDC